MSPFTWMGGTAIAALSIAVGAQTGGCGGSDSPAAVADAAAETGSTGADAAPRPPGPPAAGTCTGSCETGLTCERQTCTCAGQSNVVVDTCTYEGCCADETRTCTEVCLNLACEEQGPQGATLVGSLKSSAFSALAIDATHAFVIDSGSNNIRRVPLAGGTFEHLAAGNYIKAFALDATDVYWLEDDLIVRAPKAGGSKTTVAAGVGNGGAGIALDGDTVYAVLGNGAQLVSVPKSGGTAQVLATAGDGAAGGIALAGGAAYVTLPTKHSIVRAPLGGGAFEELVSLVYTCPPGTADCPPTGQLPTAITSSGQGQLFVTSTSTVGSVFAIDDATGKVRTFASMQSSPAGVAADASHVFWGARRICGRIYRAPRAGGAPTVLGMVSLPTALAVDSTYVYAATLEGAVYKFPK